MRTERLELASPAPGCERSLVVNRFGAPGARPKAYIQGALHADEVPGMLAAQHLCELLQRVEREGRIAGEVVVVPVANPIGLGQQVTGTPVGRFDLADGGNFNRGFPYLTPSVAKRLDGCLTEDEVANTALIRAALIAELEANPALSHTAQLKHTLARLAIDADIVLDLHCDGEAVMHIYTLTPLAARIEPLARLLGAKAVLTATESGGNPFDEAMSRPWLELAERFPSHPIPLACAAVTVELRGQADVSQDLAAADAKALCGYLVHVGVVSGVGPDLPPMLCRVTPLNGSEPVVANVGGVVAYRAELGTYVRPGHTIADIVDPLSGAITPVRARSEGILYARHTARFATAGKRIGKIAGTTLQRTGNLLSP